MRILWFFLKLFILAGLLLWLASRPGAVRIEWYDYLIETSAAFLVVAMATALYLGFLLWRLWRSVWDAPRLWRLNLKIKSMEKGHKALADSLSALAAGQPAEAGRQAVAARKALGENATTQFLLAQAAQLSGDSKAANSAFLAMIKKPESEVLGYRGLIMQALRAGHIEEARHYAERLEAVRPDVPWLNLVRYELALRGADWSHATLALEKARKSKIIPAKTAARQEAALLLARAKESLKNASPKDAVSFAERARKLMPDWVPAALILAEAQILTGHEKTALRTIEKTWRNTPHPHLLPLFRWVNHKDDPLKLYKKIRKLVRRNEEHVVSLMALAEAALKADLWGEARRHLMKLVGRGAATQATYQTLARLEHRETRQEKAEAAWTAKAVHAPLDPAWHCQSCGCRHDDWTPHCRECEGFNTLDWSVAGQSHKSAPDRPVSLMIDFTS